MFFLGNENIQEEINQDDEMKFFGYYMENDYRDMKQIMVLFGSGEENELNNFYIIMYNRLDSG